MALAAVLAAACAGYGGNQLAAQARAQPNGNLAAAQRILSVPQARKLCRQGTAFPALVTVKGFYLAWLTTQGSSQGALFATDEVSAGAAFSYHWKKYRGVYVFVPLAVYRQKGSMPGGSWVAIRGSLSCSGPSLTATSWQSISAAQPERIPTRAGRLSVHSARALCKRHPQSRYRVQVRGYFVTVYQEYVDNGGLFDHQVSRDAIDNATEEAILVADGGLPVVPSASRRRTPHDPLHDQTWVVVRGLLACNVHPLDLEVYDWQAAP